MRRILGHGLLAVPLLCFLLTAPLRPADARAGPSAAAAARVDAEVGFSGWVVPNVWMPVRIDVAAETAFDGVVDVTVGSAAYRRPIQLSSGARQRLMLYVVISDPRRPLLVSLRDTGDRPVAEQAIPLLRTRVAEGLVVALTADAAGLEFLTAEGRGLAGAYLREDSLPDHWAAYEGVNAVVLRDLDERAMSGGQRQALREWVAQGGRLLVTGERGLRQNQTWLADLLPAMVSPASTVIPSGALPGMLFPQPAAVLLPKPGADVWPARSLPVVVSRPYGRGQVTAWAFDAFAPAVRSWPGRVRLWHQLLAGGRIQPLARPALSDVIPTARTLSGGAQVQIVALSIFYILAVRFVLRRFATRRGTWLALGAVVVVFGILLYGVSAAARRAASTTVQLSVVEATGTQDLARVTTYVALLHPYGGAYVLTAPEGALIRPRPEAGPITSAAANTIGGEAAPGVLVFEAVQVISVPVHGRVRAPIDGLELEVENGTGGPLTSPAVFLNGQTQNLPDISGRLSTPLPPGRWEPADRNAATGAFGHDARAWIATRLDAYRTPAIIGYKTLWLLGDLQDPRLSVRLLGASNGRSLHLLLAPIMETGGR